MPDYSKQLSEAIESKDLMLSLKSNPGWKNLCEILDECIEQRDRELDHPLTSMDGVLKQEYTKGARQAFRHVIDLPNAMIEAAQSVIDITHEEEEDGEE